MKERFLALWKRIHAQGNAEQEFARLKDRYSEPHRFYHIMKHIEDSLTEFDSALDLVQQPDMMEF